MFLDTSVSSATPTLSTILAWSGTIFLLYYLLSALYSIYLHPLSKFPGPVTSSFSRLPFIRAHFGGKLHDYTYAIHAKYGPVARIAPDELTIISSAAWKDIYQLRPGLPKDPYSRTPPPNGAETLFTAEGDTHARIRRTFASAFSDKSLREQASTIETYASLLIWRLRRDIHQDSSNVVDIAKYYGYATLDIMGELALGDSFHSLDGNNENSWVHLFFKGVTFGSIRTSLSRYYPLDMIFGSIFLRLTSKIRMKNMALGTSLIERRLKMGEMGIVRNDLMTPVSGNIISHPQEGKQKGLTRAELDVNVLSMILAGSPLSHIAMSAVTWYSLRFPTAMETLTREIRTSFEKEEDITVVSTQDLTYLGAVINEALRIHHPTPSDPKPRLIPPEGLQVGDHWIPGGTSIALPFRAAFLSPLNFTDPLSFHPERWLPDSHPAYDPRFASDDKEAFKPFSTGTRNCMGTKIFLAEARVCLARIVYAFDIQLAMPDEWDWPDQKAYLTHEPKSVWVKLVERL